MPKSSKFNQDFANDGFTASSETNCAISRAMLLTVALIAFSAGTLLAYILLPVEGSAAVVAAAVCAVVIVAATATVLQLYRRQGNQEFDELVDLDSLQQALKSLPAEDLAAQISANSVYSAELVDAINRRQQAQSELVKAIVEPFDKAAVEIRGIGDSAGELTDKAKALTDAVKDSARAATLMVQSSADIKKSTAEATHTSQRNNEQVTRGYQLIKDMSTASADVRESVQETSKSGKRQGELIQSVTAAAEYIQALNNKISVVAINTRIEAEKAGEHGRPFLGIAEAIGDLLREAEEEGRKIIADVRLLQNMSAENLASMENTVGTVVTILEYIERLDGSLEEISSGSSAINSIIKSVDAAAGQSAGSAKNLSATMQQIRERNRDIGRCNNTTLDSLSRLDETMGKASQGLKEFSLGNANPGPDNTAMDSRPTLSDRLSAESESSSFQAAATPA